MTSRPTDLVAALGLEGGQSSPKHCASCCYGWGQAYGRDADGVMRPQTYDPTKPCRGCGRVGAVCSKDAGHSGRCEPAS